MTCLYCGRYAPPDPDTGYDADDYCSLACAMNTEGESVEDQAFPYDEDEDATTGQGS